MSSRKTNKKELGQGIRALLNTKTEVKSTSLPPIKRAVSQDQIIEIALDQINVNPYQPRNEFEKESLQELAESIKIHGVIQPITIRKINQATYQIISGERRFRASKIVGKKTIPAYIRIADDQGLLEMALIENVQREDLNPIEIAITLNRLMNECELTHDKLSERISKKRSTVTNYLRLLKLPPDIQSALKNKKISMGHAKAILSLEDVASQLLVFKQVLSHKLSVRATETLAKKYLIQPATNKPSIRTLPLEYKKIEERLSGALGSKVKLHRSKSGTGTITIPFSSDDHLNDLIEIIEEP